MPPALSSMPSPPSPSVIVSVAVTVTAALFRLPRSFKHAALFYCPESDSNATLLDHSPSSSSNQTYAQAIEPMLPPLPYFVRHP
ncbi:hypothetical protein R3P38DRAFT_3232367 [Favolaschia claudopus]|uniref:Secreted protein n=1 Tax=Favolaschia claudopus TaxID=2862362 RepID=A0AAV9ZJE8_9AGAR